MIEALLLGWGRLPQVTQPFQQPGLLREHCQTEPTFQSFVLCQTVTAPFLVVEIYQIEDARPTVEYVDCPGLSVFRDQREKQCARRKLNPANDLRFRPFCQP